jgi:hypothetical protein
VHDTITPDGFCWKLCAGWASIALTIPKAPPEEDLRIRFSAAGPTEAD